MVRLVPLVAMLGALGGAGCNLVFGLDAPDDDDGSGDGGDGGAIDAREIDANPDDVDGDGVLNGADNCPMRVNPLQADEDGDAEINGGDACDPCPHLGSMPAGQPHLDVDLDGIGDDCDPNALARHCIAWFDGFREGVPAEILARYTTSGGGVWFLDEGRMRQSDVTYENTLLTVRDGEFGAAAVTTHGVMDGLPVAQTGNVPYRNAIGVVANYRDDGQPGTCYGSVTRDVVSSSGGPAKAALAYSTMVNEIVADELVFSPPGTPMVVGERLAVTLDAVTSVDMPIVTGSLPQRAGAAQVGGIVTCNSGSAGLRTAYAAMYFDYLLVIIEEPQGGCPARGPTPPDSGI
jgi:hypothetical protein